MPKKLGKKSLSGRGASERGLYGANKGTKKRKKPEDWEGEVSRKVLLTRSTGKTSGRERLFGRRNVLGLSEIAQAEQTFEVPSSQFRHCRLSAKRLCLEVSAVQVLA